MNTVGALRERLVALDWTFGIDDTREETKARIALFREFPRRSAPYTALHPAQPAAWPFFDAAARVDPSVRAPENVTGEVAAKVPRYPASAVRNTCVSALHFAALLDSGKVLPPYQDPVGGRPMRGSRPVFI